MGLPLQTVDVFLSALAETPADHQGPIGRLSDLRNVIARRFTLPTKTTGLQLRVEPRDGFASFTTAARSIVDGSTVSATWTNPEILAPLGEQLVEIDNTVPRVWNGSRWTQYPDSQILTQELTTEVLHTGQRTSQASDSAWEAGVTCSVWTEITQTASGPVTVAWIGFRADNKAWIVAPKPLYAPAGNAYVLAKVVSDGSAFWVVYSNTLGQLAIQAYDNTGSLVASSATSRIDGSNPGIWDIVVNPNGGIILAQPTAIGVDSGVSFESYHLSGGSIVAGTSAVDSSIHCVGPLAWLRDDLSTGSVYLGTQGPGGDSAGDLWGYQVSPTTLLQTHEYNAGMGPPGGFTLDSITGYVFDSASPGVVLSWSQLPATPARSGPIYDPALRSSTSVQVANDGTVTLLRTTQSLIQVSRAFPVDGSYVAWAYYESGGGSQPLSSLSITPVLGDTFTGAASQPLPVTAGDRVVGSAINVNSQSVVVGPNVSVSDSSSALSVVSGDTVTGVTVTGLSGYGIPDGTLLLRWHFANLSPTTDSVGSRLTLTGTTGVAGANTTWDIVAINSGTGSFYTLTNDITGAFPISAGGTFGSAGTVQRIAMAAYEVADLSPYISSLTASAFTGGSVVITGTGIGGNSGTFTTARVYYGSGPNYGFAAASPVGVIWVVKTTQSTETHTFSAKLTPVGTNQWTFTGGAFDSTYVGAQLVISSDPAQPGNVGTYTISSVQSPTTFTTSDATSLISQVFTASGASAEIQLTTQTPYTWRIGAAVADYTYLGAIVSLTGAYAPNVGTYRVVQVNADGSFVATPTNGTSSQVNEAFGPSQSITIFFVETAAPQFQSTFFLMPLAGSQPVVGRVDYGVASADWRQEAATPANPYPLALSSPVAVPAGIQTVLPYRAENVTSANTVQTPGGAVVVPGQETTTNTVGLKTYTLSTVSGQAYAAGSQLSICGPMATIFSGTGFFEDGVNIAPEKPFLVSQSVASTGQLALTPGATYEYACTLEYTENDGTRVFSIPGPTLEVQMSGSNNVATIGGRLPFPLDTNGQPIPNVYGVTCRQISICIYRTAWINGTPTTKRFKITSDLNPNARAPTSATNQSGFSFPDSFTWNFRDQTPDGDLNASEALYTDQGYKPRYPSPPFSRGCIWNQRRVVIADDGSIWISNEETEGLATSFNPALRVVLPTLDRPKAIAAIEEYLLICGSSGLWYLPNQQLPDATGANGSLPTPVPLPFSMGSKNGHAATISPADGVCFDSTQGGVWQVDRALRLSWLSMPVQDSLTTDVTGLTIDAKQRVIVQQTTGPWCVLDSVPGAWYLWDLPSAPKLVASYSGQPIYADTNAINTLVPGSVNDVVNGTTTAIVPDFTLAPVSLANVRGVKLVHELQLVGKYLGPHGLNWVISYPDTPGATSTTGRWVPDPSKPYVYPAWPGIPDNTTFSLRVYADFTGVESPGSSFALELVSVEVGVMPGGLSKVRAPNT